MSEKSVSLVLGSGGARGLAHVGVIRYLEESGYEICSISGCSIGALVGGVYALGKLEEFDDWACAIRRRDIGSAGSTWRCQSRGENSGNRIYG